MIDGVDEFPIPLILGALFLVGLAADILGRFTALPRVTLLMLCGLAAGPVGFALLPASFLENWFPPLTSAALALVGFLLGQQVSVGQFRKHGARIVGISLCKVFGAWLAVLITLLLLGVSPTVAVLLAGIAPATAPTATYDVVRESGISGDFTNTLLSIVALDDLWGLMLFTVMLAFVGVSNGDATVANGLAAGLFEIGGSLSLGFFVGIPMAYLTGRIREGEPTLAEAMGFVLLGAGLAEWLALSPILTAMTMGAVVASLAKHHERPFHAIEGIEWPFMILFFVLAGASLELKETRIVAGLIAAYILARGIGIYFGTRFGTRLAGAGRRTQKWLGVALFPQAGVAIGMALLAAQHFPEVAPILLPVVLGSTMVLELLAPVATRYAIGAATASSRSGGHE